MTLHTSQEGAPTHPGEHILITGASGFIGQELTASLVRSSPALRLTLADVAEPNVPPTVAHHASHIATIQSDLTSPTAVEKLLSERFTAVYLLHGLMSGGAEADLELGLKVNLDSHRLILDHLRRNQPGVTVVFPSSLAVYGPSTPGQITSEETCPIPQSSYGAEKLIIETLINDFSRRGSLDGRVVRLPTVVVRPGAPSAAASSFASGIVRESLNGERNILPVAPDLKMWISSPSTVVKNLIHARTVPRDKFGLSRVINLPGKTVAVKDILDALEVVGGKKALMLVEERRDPRVEAIVSNWPAQFDTGRASSLGMTQDVELVQTVRAFANSLV